MLRCTYIVLIHNNVSNIPGLVDSLKKTNGNFRKEFIFIDDGSTDNSLNTLKLTVNDLARSTIITQTTEGPSISINKASNLASGDYIHFVEGHEILHPNSTNLLIESSLKLGTQISVGRVAPNIIEDEINTSPQLIDTPIKEILLNNLSAVRRVGKAGSLVHRELLEKIGGADSSIYTQNMSLSLRCAKYSKFAYINANISSYSEQANDNTKQFISYNNIKSIYNFAKNNPEFFTNLTPELLVSLSKEEITNSSKTKYLLQSIVNKYIQLTPFNKILNSYKTELDRLF